MEKLKQVLKIFAFWAVVFLVFCVFQSVFHVQEKRCYQLVKGFYEEEKNSLDAVYIGSSIAYAYYSAPLAWENYGIAVYPYASSQLPVSAVRYRIEEAKKTQPDALYIVNMNTIDHAGISVEMIHYTVDFMPMSMTKIKLIERLTELAGIKGTAKAEFYLPFIRFHSAVDSDLEIQDYTKLDGLKGGLTYSSFLNTLTDVTKYSLTAEDTVTLSEEQLRDVTDLLDYCDEQQVKVLFTFSPKTCVDSSSIAVYEETARIIRERGYDVLNYYEHLDELGLDLANDYYNTRHTNIHGCMKTTDYLARYLIEQYGFSDKRGEAAYAGWNQAASAYSEILSPYVLDIEKENAKRTDACSVSMKKPVSDGEKITVSWKTSGTASGYRVYRKTDLETAKAWVLLTEINDPEADSFVDQELVGSGKYTYTVVPFFNDGSALLYGSYELKGSAVRVSGTS